MNAVNRARGRWREILPLVGIEPRFLVNRHGPCPWCGGRDRFRFDDKEGSGSFYCNQCGPGVGIIAVRRALHCDHATACREVERILGDEPAPAPMAGKPKVDDAQKRRAAIEKVLREADRRKVVDDYLAARGIAVTSRVLKGHSQLPHSRDGTFNGYFPAVIGPVIGPDGSLQSLQRIYVAEVEPRKKLMPAVDTIRGGAVRLHEPAGGTLGIAEGIETALACLELFDVPTWAALNAGNLEVFAPPEGIGRLVIFADNDTNSVGQAAAFAAAKRLHALKIETEVRIPPQPDTDWLDYLNGRR